LLSQTGDYAAFKFPPTLRRHPRGAVAILDDTGELLAIHDMPSLEEIPGRPATNAPVLAALLAQSHARIAFFEFVSARPTDARTAAFAFGRAGRAA
jgi:hypothetical protein